jgi:hypothetical protein
VGKNLDVFGRECHKLNVQIHLWIGFNEECHKFTRSNSTYSVPFHEDPEVPKPRLPDKCACFSRLHATCLPCFESCLPVSNIRMLQEPTVDLSACNALRLFGPLEHRAASKNVEFCTKYIADSAC